MLIPINKIILWENIKQKYMVFTHVESICVKN